LDQFEHVDRQHWVNSAHYQPVVESTELSATATGYISDAHRPVSAVR